MDELTRERFLVPRLPPPEYLRSCAADVLAERHRILLGMDVAIRQEQAEVAEQARTARMRAFQLRRDKALAAAIRRSQRTVA